MRWQGEGYLLITMNYGNGDGCGGYGDLDKDGCGTMDGTTIRIAMTKTKQ